MTTKSNNLKGILTKGEILKLIERTTPNVKFNLRSVEISPASDEKLGFLADHFKMVVELEYDGAGATLNYFLKSLPLDNEEQAKYIREYNFMNREIVAYELMKSIANSEGEVIWLPKFYLATDSALIFEDLNVSGFKMANPRDYFTKEHCFVALESLANLHAASLIYEEKRSKENNGPYRLEREYGNVFDVAGYVYEGWYAAGVRAMLDAVEEFSQYGRDVDTFSMVKENWEAVWKRALDLGQPCSQRRNVLCHRDLWASNIMFRLDPRGAPAQCVFVDLQGVRSLPPAADVVPLIYLNSRRCDRAEWISELIEHYYAKLGVILRKSGFEVDMFVEKSQFLQDCERYKLFALMMCGSLHPLGTLKKSYKKYMFSNNSIYRSLLTTDRSDFIRTAMREDSEYRYRIIESLDEMIEIYFLDQTVIR